MTFAERVVLAINRESKEFSTEKALRRYLKEHPEADKKKHTVTKGKPSKSKEDTPSKVDSPQVPEDTKKNPEKGGRLDAWKGKFKDLSSKAQKMVESSPKAVKHFLGNEEFRTQALKEASSFAKKSPKKLLNNLVSTAKHEVHEFKTAGKGLASAMIGKKVSSEQKKAIRAVATHMAIAGTAAAFMASGPLSGAGLFGKALVKHIAMKAAHKALGSLHTLEEVGHISHGVAHLLTHIASEENEEKPAPEQALAMLVMATVAKEIENLEEGDLVQALEEDEVEEMGKEARVVARYLQAKAESMGVFDGNEYFWPTISKWSDLPEKRDAFDDVYIMQYEFEGRELSGFLVVEFNANDFINSDGRRPGKWEAKYLGRTAKGTWKKIDEIPKVLSHVVKWAQNEAKAITKLVENAGSPKWEGQFNGFEVIYDFKSPRGTDAAMTATLSYLDEFLQEGGGNLELHYSAGYDYEGNFGERTKEIRFSGGIQGLKKALQNASKIWDRWHVS